jgi:hypothetical protein
VYNAAVKPALLFAFAVCLPAADLRIGIIGTDTSPVRWRSRRQSAYRPAQEEGLSATGK